MPVLPPALVYLFLSTLSLRRATLAPQLGIAFECNFYPRSPCGERLLLPRLIQLNSVFLSTLSLRRATGRRSHLGSSSLISIHALLAESDPQHNQTVAVPHHFYPRSPCGERRAY